MFTERKEGGGGKGGRKSNVEEAEAEGRLRLMTKRK